MNQRIRDFERQSKLELYSLGKDRANWESALNTFAELIVQECADLAGCNGHVSGFSLGDLLKEHFEINRDDI
jgi:hypothetical protein